MRSDALARRIRIIEAACEIFRTSTDIVPLETIADKAGVGIATLYRNFPDRTALIHACAAYMFDKVIELQQSVLERFRGRVVPLCENPGGLGNRTAGVRAGTG